VALIVWTIDPVPSDLSTVVVVGASAESKWFPNQVFRVTRRYKVNTNKITNVYPQDLSGWEKLYGGAGPSPADQLAAQTIVEFRTFSAQFQEYIEKVIERGDFDAKRITPDRLRARFYQVFNDYWAPLGQVAAQRQISIP